MSRKKLRKSFPSPPNAKASSLLRIDPLDGSSLVDVNLAVGTIVSILRRGRYPAAWPQPAGRLYILYGPRTTLVLSTGKGVHEFAMNQLMEYTLVQENIRMAPQAAIYSPGGLRNKYSPGTEKFVTYLEGKGAKLRYSGGLVPDINQILIKGKGIFLYPHLQGMPRGKAAVAV